jgi:hypothetical protein
MNADPSPTNGKMLRSATVGHEGSPAVGTSRGEMLGVVQVARPEASDFLMMD